MPSLRKSPKMNRVMLAVIPILWNLHAIGSITASIAA